MILNKFKLSLAGCLMFSTVAAVAGEGFLSKQQEVEPKKNTLLIKCDNSNSNEVKSIEIYGVTNSMKVSNISTVVYVTSKSGLDKQTQFGGKGTAGKLACVFTDILGDGSSLSIYDDKGLLSLKDNQNREILFNNCTNYF